MMCSGTTQEEPKSGSGDEGIDVETQVKNLSKTVSWKMQIFLN